MGQDHDLGAEDVRCVLRCRSRVLGRLYLRLSLAAPPQIGLLHLIDRGNHLPIEVAQRVQPAPLEEPDHGERYPAHLDGGLADLGLADA